MRSSSLAIVISLQSLSYYCNGFSPLVQVQHKNNNNGLSAATEKERQPSLFAITHHNDNSDERIVQLPKVATTIAATTTLALSLTIMGASSSVAAYDYHQSPLPTTTITSSSITSSTIQLGASYSESDFADFSLPSYSDVASAEINTNLKGGKDLLDDQYKDMTR